MATAGATGEAWVQRFTERWQGWQYEAKRLLGLNDKERL